jgi:membrane-associated phospholipid phosphatase
MRTSEWRAARDYNRGLIPPVRWLHTIWGAIAAIAGPARAWLLDPRRRAWAPYLAAGIVAFVLLLPLDGAVSRALRSVRLGGDARRELEAFQQWGQGVSTVLVALVIWLQDPARRRSLADWGAALGVTAAAVFAMKMLIGRPRPKYDDPLYFLGPFGQYPVDRVVAGRPVGVRHAWELGSGISADLWSMPSNHTAYALVMAVALAAMYPRLRVLVVACAGVVGLARVWTGGHYPTDVLVGAVLGLSIGRAAMRGMWGQRTLSRLGLVGQASGSPVPGPGTARRPAERPLKVSDPGTDDSGTQDSGAPGASHDGPAPKLPVHTQPRAPGEPARP